MRLIVISDVFPPIRNSGAVQVRDLCAELFRLGHDVLAVVPNPGSTSHFSLEKLEGVQVLRLSIPLPRRAGYIGRALSEAQMPFYMAFHFLTGPLRNDQFDGIIWYSPSIFHGPFVFVLRKLNRCPSYLIIRDIFPEWAVDLGLLRRGIAFWFLKAVAAFQYWNANVIGVQSEGNVGYFRNWTRPRRRRIEVLPNWLASPGQAPCSIKICDSILANRTIFVYAGNMGVAQSVSIFLDVAERLRDRVDVGFLFVGRGNEVLDLRSRAENLKLRNVLFCDEIEPDEIPALYAQCHVGLIALDVRHRTHNIPGKFLTYMQCGLPVLARVNPDNDLTRIVRAGNVGLVSESDSADLLFWLACELLTWIEADPGISARCRAIFSERFSVTQVAGVVIDALNSAQ